ncbi:MAG TPA: 16S rRNA (guanine(527)-N(7))-methyltransferase RsmG [Burkholderiales bacterium]|nr:16S rRNA (guanine(527)-N(7))-methyltransferase RsmG [Burkholderiales bacterium]
MSQRDILATGVRALDLALSDQQLDALMDYVGLLQKWNRVYNLTAVRDPAAMIPHHLLDSLAVVAHIPAGALLDVGSGPGLPGIPIAIAQPQRKVDLLDSNDKKSSFARQAAGTLGLANVSVHCLRVEHWPGQARFPVIISRAFAELRQFVTWCAPLLADDGVLAAMKGVYPETELRDLPAGFGVREAIRLDVPGLNAERHLLLIGKL